MNPRINQLVKSLLQKDSLDQCTLPELKQFADRHPFFGAAQLLLTKKMQTESPDLYDEQLQKTFSFFHNPLWVEQMLNDAGIAIITPAVKEVTTIKEEPVIESTIPAATNITEPTSEPEPAPIVSSPEPEISLPASEPEITTEPVSIISAASALQPEAGIDTSPAAEPITETPDIKPEQAASQDLVFEPYHTIDYFASQGIKFKEEEKPGDKFGQQLKSFTEWLRMMKRVPVAEMAKTSQPVMEKKVEEMAEHSLEEKEVITEAMAAVWEKQGNREKAMEIYSKLSLLEPAKSVYFAAKIEDLKKQN